MTSDDRPWQAQIERDAGRTRIFWRNRWAVLGWTTATLVVLFAGLLTHLRAGPLWLMLACYGAAGICGILLLAYLFVRRLYVTHPPER